MNPNHLHRTPALTRRRVGRYMRLETDDDDDATIRRHRLEHKRLGLPPSASMAFVFGVPLGCEIYAWPIASEYLQCESLVSSQIFHLPIQPSLPHPAPKIHNPSTVAERHFLVSEKI